MDLDIDFDLTDIDVGSKTAFGIPSETWFSLMNVGLAALVARKIHQSTASAEEDEEDTDAKSAAALAAGAFYSGQTDFQITGEATESQTTQFGGGSYQLIGYQPYISGNYLLSPMLTNTFVGWGDYGSGGGPTGEATNSISGYGSIGTTDSSFMSESTFGEDVSNAIGGFVGAAIGIGFKGITGIALSAAFGPFGMLGTLVGSYALSKAMPSNQWGSWSYLKQKFSEMMVVFGLAQPDNASFLSGIMGMSDPIGAAIGAALGFGPTSDPVASAIASALGLADFGLAYEGDFGIGTFGENASLGLGGSWGIGGEMGYSSDMDAGGLGDGGMGTGGEGTDGSSGTGGGSVGSDASNGDNGW